MEYVKPELNWDEQAIFKTLLYSDIFDFPLSSDELWEFLLTSVKIKRKVFEKTLEELLTKNLIVHKDGYFCLSGRGEIIKKRKENLPEVEKKLLIAKKATYYLSYIPTIKLIGISGGLAMYDADPNDDIDFFIITRKKALFVTRIWVLGILSILKLRRTRIDRNPADKICVNFFVDETRLNFPKEKRDIYVAHEIVQIKPLFERDNLYRKFLRVNNWVKKFFPNTNASDITYPFQRQKVAPSFIKTISVIFDFSFFAGFLEWVQLRSIRRHQTTENVSNSILAFHPNDYRVQILKELNLKMQEFGLLTKI